MLCPSTTIKLVGSSEKGPEAPLKPVEIIGVQKTPLESCVSFNIEGAIEALSSGSLEIMDETGKIKYFGPYSREKPAIPGKAILGVRPKGDFTAKMTGQTKSRKTIIKEAPLRILLWTLSKAVELMR